MELNLLGKYLMNLPTVYEIETELPESYFQPNRNIILKSKLPLSDVEIQCIREYAKEVVPVIFTLTIKNAYDGGEKTYQIT